MNTSVNGRLPVLVWFHGQSYFTLFLLYTTFWFRSTEQNRWRLRFWDHTPVPSRFINEIFSETFYLRIIWISSWAVWILGSVHPVYIQMNSIPLSFKVETKYVVVEISTLVFSVRYSTTVTINITKGSFTDASQRAALEWVQRYIRNFGGDSRLFDSFFHIHYN